MHQLSVRIFQAIFIALACHWLTGIEAVPAITWMNIYDLEDFKYKSWSELFSFVSNNRLPIPPLVLAAELSVYKILGSVQLITIYFYKFAICAPYVVAMEMVKLNRVRFLATYAVSILFLFGSIQIHQGNPQGYDVYLPCFLLLFVYFFERSVSGGPLQTQCLYALYAGLALSLAELTRPFMIFVLPAGLLISVISYCRFKKVGLILTVVFLMPVVSLSGSFHIFKWVKHQQLTFSNNTGFNLSRAWGRVIVVPPLLDESKYLPIKEGRWPNLDTDEHQINSERFKQAVVEQWLNHPVQSASFAMSLLNDFLAGETRIYDHNPNSIFLQAYKLVYKCLAGLLLVNGLVLVGCVLMYRRRVFDRITDRDNLTILLTAFLILIFAIGEKGEEARFIISVLPLLALIPLARVNDIGAENSSVPPDGSKISFNW